jgi:transcriptional regulator with XRE-family HTH domain
MATFGKYLQGSRLALNEADPGEFSLRKVAGRSGIHPSYLSQVENDKLAAPGEETIKRLADVLEEDPDVLLALGGKVSSELQDIISKRPALFAQLIRQLKNEPDDAILHLVREVKDGKW